MAGDEADPQAKVKTPADCQPPPKVAVFGAGIAGLTAAHELAERGFKVTVYEPQKDPREAGKAKGWKRIGKLLLGGAKEPQIPEVRLGGLAATQFLSDGRLRRFPASGPSGPVKTPDPAPANWPPTGEHGFRFFPAYYLHLWDMLQRIPVCDDNGRVTSRTVYDNVQRVITQAVTSVDGKPLLVLPREAPRSLSEVYGAFDQMRQLGFSVTDLSTFLGRMARYLVTSPTRRARELEEISAYEFFLNPDPVTGRERYRYSDAFMRQILDMPKILAAFDARWGDARTNISTYVQLNMALDRYDSKADGVLSGPTSEAWFDHWYRHLGQLGVKFRLNGLKEIRLTKDGKSVEVELADGTKLGDCTYYVVATDAHHAELATRTLRAQELDRFEFPRADPSGPADAPPTERDRRYARAMSTVLGLDGWSTSAPPDVDPRDPNRAQGLKERDPREVKALGVRPWDRYQTLSGIQFYFDTEFQIVRGHVYFSNSEWGLSAINQAAFWTDEPSLATDGYAGVMSVDIGDWNRPSSKTGRAARESSRDEIAEEVWRQITAELAHSSGPGVGARQVPTPTWYAIDEFLTFADVEQEDGKKRERPVMNEAPYLIPIVGDWKNRPGGYPWNPHGTSATYVPPEAMRAEQKKRGVWQARHGGYQVHHDRIVFAGTWCKTFTRMTTMEAACESARHAVNAIIDHYLYEASGGTDERDLPALSWRMPFGFVDQELSSPIRQPTPAGDYCFIFDCENREPADARPTRVLDGQYLRAGLPHPWQIWGIDSAAAVASSFGTYGPGDVYDPTLWIIDQLRQWRTVVERVYGGGAPGDWMSTRSADWDTGTWGDEVPPRDARSSVEEVLTARSAMRRDRHFMTGGDGSDQPAPTVDGLLEVPEASGPGGAFAPGPDFGRLGRRPDFWFDPREGPPGRTRR